MKEMEKEFYDRISVVAKLSIKANEEHYRRTVQKVRQSLEKCKLHGGPLTTLDIDKLDNLEREEVLAEAGYLKHTIAPNICLKRKEGNQFIKFSAGELRDQICDAVNPRNTAQDNVDQLSTQKLTYETSNCNSPQI